MKQSIIIILLTMLMGMISIKAFADFEAKNADGITIRYRILNEGKYDEGLNVEGFQYDAEKLVIPKSVDYNGKTYPVKYMISSSAYSHSLLSHFPSHQIEHAGGGALALELVFRTAEVVADLLE